MENLLSIVGIVVIIVSTIMIVKAKKTSSENDENSESVKRRSRRSYRDEVDFTDEEVEFISKFDTEESDSKNISNSFELNLKKNGYESDFESSISEHEEPLDKTKETGQETDRKEAIAMLYREGLTSSEIAKKLEMGRREVDIILKVKGLTK